MSLNADAQTEPQLNQKLIVDKAFFKPICIAFNFFFSIIIALLIVHAVNVNILSRYINLSKYDGHSYELGRGDLWCGWNTFTAIFCNGYSSYTGIITTKHFWTATSNQSTGKAWFYCNITSLILLFMSELGYIKIYYYISKSKNKINTTKLKQIYFITILFQSFMPTLLLLFGIIHWFQRNTKNPGCWNHQYHVKLETVSDYSGGVQKDVLLEFNGRRLGESMKFDMIAVVLLGIHLIVHCGLLLCCCKRKNNEPTLGELSVVVEEGVVEGDGHGEMIHMLPVQYMQYIHNAMNDNNQSTYNKHPYLVIKAWFDESVAIQNSKDNNFKEIYYNKFIEQGFDNFVAIKAMNNQDLIDIGVDKLGHRKTIMIAIQQLQ